MAFVKFGLALLFLFSLSGPATNPVEYRFGGTKVVSNHYRSYQSKRPLTSHQRLLLQHRAGQEFG